MKKLLYVFASLAAFAVEDVLAAGGIPAKEAVRTLGREKGASWLDRIVQINGDRGIDQPGAWHIVASDGRGGWREFFINSKGILTEGPVPPAVAARIQGPVVSQKKFTLDSTMAFMKANAAAKKARLGYDSASYQLRSTGAASAPVWIMQLNNAAGQKVADVTLSASTGKVTHFVTYNPPPPPPPAPPPTQGQVAMDRTKEAVNRGAASVGRGLNKAGGWIRRKFGTQQQTPEYYVPPRAAR